MIKRLLLVALALACGSEGPVAIDPAHDSCHVCRMIISDTRTAAQILAPGEEPRLFDDLGCLSDELAKQKRPGNWQIFVMDYDGGGWIAAERAHFERCPDLETPMGSHLIARGSSTARPGCTSAEVIR